MQLVEDSFGLPWNSNPISDKAACCLETQYKGASSLVSKTKMSNCTYKFPETKLPHDEYIN